VSAIPSGWEWARDNRGVACQNSPPPFEASTVEMVCRALGEVVRGHQIANLIGCCCDEGSRCTEGWPVDFFEFGFGVRRLPIPA
jgi:hypothetical protein